MIYPIILAGGQGERLWPLSTETVPKQFLKLITKRTLFSETVLRFGNRKLFHPLIIVTNAKYRSIVEQELIISRIENYTIILEPTSKNTAPSIALAGFYIKEILADKNATMLICPSDHYIGNADKFNDYISHAEKYAMTGNFAIFGIKTDSKFDKELPKGYGYIKSGEKIDEIAYYCEKFVEKPNKETLTHLTNDEGGNYYINSGIFVFGVNQYLSELNNFEPEVYESCREAVDKHLMYLGSFLVNKSKFLKCKSISVDHAIAEKSNKFIVIENNLDWMDLGEYQSLHSVLPKDENENAIIGKAIIVNSRKSYINTYKNSVVIGLDNVAIVDTKTGLLVVNMNESENIKKAIEVNELSKSLATREDRPWGEFEQIDSGEGYRVKKITITPQGRISLQFHKFRSEHWVVISGTAKITRGNEEITLQAGESIHIPKNVYHRIENIGNTNLTIIETQIGEYISEEDVVRIEDAYGRYCYKLDNSSKDS